MISHIKDHKKQLNDCLKDLEKIVKLERNISASLIVETIDKAVSILTEPFVSQINDLDAIRKFSLDGMQKHLLEMDSLIVKD